MSRIDEALKRSSHGARVGRIPSRGNDAVVHQLTEESVLSDYPLEKHNGHVGVDTPSFPSELTRPPRAAVRTQLSALSANIDQSAKLVVGSSGNAAFIEQYRRLAATLHEAQTEKGLKTVMVTSAVPKEGKTLTVINLALTLAESYGRRVLLIDADLRKPSIHEVLGIPNDKGLSELLRSGGSAPMTVSVSPRLQVLPSGRSDDNPLAGLSSGVMRTFVDDMASKFDWVLLDTPPVGLLSDAQVLGRVAQAAIFVIRAGATPYPVVERAITNLGADCIIGTVLNGVEERAVPATDYYGHYYYSQQQK